MESERGRIFRSGNWARRYKNGGGEGKGYFGLANTKVHQGCPEVPKTGKLLLLIHTGLCIHSSTLAQPGEKGSEVGVDRKAEESI